MDVLDLLDAHRKVEAERCLTQISIAATTNMKEEDFRKFVGGLRKEAGFDVVDNPKFDEAGFEALKMRLKMGI
jgi:hypothetical protein